MQSQDRIKSSVINVIGHKDRVRVLQKVKCYEILF